MRLPGIDKIDDPARMQVAHPVANGGKGSDVPVILASNLSAFLKAKPMKTILLSLFVLITAGLALADPPATQPICTGKFTAIEANSISFKFLSRSRGGHVMTESTTDKTVVILSDGTQGKIGDLKVGQTARITLDESREVAIKIEVGKSSWESTNSPATQPSENKGFGIHIESWDAILFSSPPTLTDQSWLSRKDVEAVIARYVDLQAGLAEVTLGKKLDMGDNGREVKIDEIQAWLVAQGIKDITFRLATSKVMSPVVRQCRNGKTVILATQPATDERETGLWRPSTSSWIGD